MTIEKKKKEKKKKHKTNKQTKMIKNKPKTRIKANQHHKQFLGPSKPKQQTVTVWSSKTSVKVIWHNKHWQMKKKKTFVDG